MPLAHGKRSRSISISAKVVEIRFQDIHLLSAVRAFACLRPHFHSVLLCDVAHGYGARYRFTVRRLSIDTLYNSFHCFPPVVLWGAFAPLSPFLLLNSIPLSNCSSYSNNILAIYSNKIFIIYPQKNYCINELINLKLYSSLFIKLKSKVSNTYCFSSK